MVYIGERKMPVTTRSKSKQQPVEPSQPVEEQAEQKVESVKQDCMKEFHFGYEKQIYFYEKLSESVGEDKWSEYALTEIYILSAIACKYIYYIESGVFCKNKSHLMKTRNNMVADFIYLSMTEWSDELERAVKSMNNLIGQLDRLIAKQ